MRTSLRVWGLITTVVLASVASSRAESIFDTYWVKTDNPAIWSWASHWSNLEPNLLVDAIINNTGTATIPAGHNEYCSSLYLGWENDSDRYTYNKYGRLEIEGGTLTAAHKLFIGYHNYCYDGYGIMNVRDGGVVTNDSNGYIGYTRSGSYYELNYSQVTVEGDSVYDYDTHTWSYSRSQWNNGGALYVGDASHGKLHIYTNGTVNNTNAYIGHDYGIAGEVKLTSNEYGPYRPTWNNTGNLYVGYSGYGTLEVSGGYVDSADGYIGYYSTYDNAVTIDYSGNWNNSGALYVGCWGRGTLNVKGGGEVSNTAGYIARYSGANGTVTVTGSGSTWTNSGQFFVGYEGTATGTLNITSGGLVTNTTGVVGCYADTAGVLGTGTVNVDAATWTNNGNLQVGNSGVGTVNISTGGSVTSYDGYVGNYVGSTGTMTVDTDATWTNSTDLYVGRWGEGTLTVTGEGEVSNTTGYIGRYSVGTGTVTVSGTGSTWTNNGNLYVAYEGNGELEITGGGTVTDNYCNIGHVAASTGTVTVEGTGSTWTHSGNLVVGEYGEGTMTVSGGGEVSNGYGYIGNHAGSTGTVTVSGSESLWDNGANLNVGYYGTGTLEILAGGTVRNTNGHVGLYAGSTGAVTVDGYGSTWTNQNGLYVGYQGTGTLTVTGGGLVTADAGLFIDHDGGGESFVNMSTGGRLALLGEADDDIYDFLGLVSGTDAIRYWNGTAWDDITNATPGVDYTLTYHTTGDLEGYTVLTVPEPAALSLLALGGVAILRRRRRRR